MFHKSWKDQKQLKMHLIILHLNSHAHFLVGLAIFIHHACCCWERDTCHSCLSLTLVSTGAQRPCIRWSDTGVAISGGRKGDEGQRWTWDKHSSGKIMFCNSIVVWKINSPVCYTFYSNNWWLKQNQCMTHFGSWPIVWEMLGQGKKDFIDLQWQITEVRRIQM